MLILPAGSTGARVSQKQYVVVFKYVFKAFYAYDPLWLVFSLASDGFERSQSPFRLFEVQSLET